MNNLYTIAIKARKLILESSYLNRGHLSSSLSCIDIVIALYFGGILNLIKIKNQSPTRDRFILSKGHAELSLYTVLGLKNFFPVSDLIKSCNSKNAKLGSHVSHKVKGVELSTGSLGHGLSFACGISLAAKINKTKNYQYVLMGDAECTEGSTWEAALFASKHKLDNLIVIIDRNNIAALDFVHKFTKLEPLASKWRSFGWNVSNVDGHNISSIIRKIKNFKNKKNNKPSVIIAKTIKGKGISFVENDASWHVKGIKDLQMYLKAKKELK